MCLVGETKYGCGCSRGWTFEACEIRQSGKVCEAPAQSWVDSLICENCRGPAWEHALQEKEAEKQYVKELPKRMARVQHWIAHLPDRLAPQAQHQSAEASAAQNPHPKFLTPQNQSTEPLTIQNKTPAVSSYEPPTCPPPTTDLSGDGWPDHEVTSTASAPGLKPVDSAVGADRRQTSSVL